MLAADGQPPLSERVEIGLELRRARKRAGLETYEAAEKGGVSVTQLGNIERGTHSLTSMSAGNLARLPAAFGLTWEQFTAIVAPSYAPYIPFLKSQSAPNMRFNPFDEVEDLGEVVMLRVYDLAQASKPIMELEPLEGYDPVYLPRKTTKPGTALFRVQGHSMTIGGVGGIMEGDVVMVDTRDLEPMPEKIYVIHIPGDGVTLKRVRWLGDDLWLFSDNEDQTAYPPFRADKARVIGRVYDGFKRLPVRF